MDFDDADDETAPRDLNIKAEGTQNGCSKNENLWRILSENTSGCDFVFCLFMSALNSYRADRCLRPFPQLFVNCDNEKDFQLLRGICDKIPPIKEILNAPKKCSKDVVRLFSWIFLDKGYPMLKRCNFTNLPVPLYNSITPKPQYVFEVCYPDKLETNWINRKGIQDAFYAYHGSSTDNFYSILKVGLQQHFSIEKEVLFGNGIYLSNELSVCTHYAPYSETWKNSALGNKHSVIAVCEVINDIKKVKCKDARHKQRSKNADSLGEIPDKYFVVTDSDMVRIKYLLVYESKKNSSVKSYVSGNLLWLALLLYFFMLVVIGFFNGSSWPKILRYFSK